MSEVSFSNNRKMLIRSVLLMLLIGSVYSHKLDFSNISQLNDNRIVGGENAVEGQFPYQVSLRITIVDQHFCGGSIISASWVLSAAHCTEAIPPGLTVSVVVGTVKLAAGGTRYPVQRIINHPDYDDDTLEYDVSLVQTTTPIVFGLYVSAVLPGSSFVPAGTAGTFSGWGQTSEPGSNADNLQYLDMTVLSNEECIERQTTYPSLIFDSKICTFAEFGQGMCFGDSGGPLTSGGFVVGIASWVMPCAVGYPDVFDRVSEHYSWIIANAY